MRTELFGEEHTDVARSSFNLANVLIRLQQFEEAAVLASSAAETFERELSPGSPWTMAALRGLASAELRGGRFDEAEAAAQRALRLATEHHLDRETVLAHNNLATISQERGNLSLADEEFRRALSLSEQSFGAQHRTTLSVMGNLALARLEQGDAQEALRLLEKASDAATEDCNEALLLSLNLTLLRIHEGQYEAAKVASDELAQRCPEPAPRLVPAVNLIVALLELHEGAGAAKLEMMYEEHTTRSGASRLARVVSRVLIDQGNEREAAKWTERIRRSSE